MLNGATVKCPECGSERLYRDGLRYLKNGSTVQRWLCRNCGCRFTQPYSNNSDAPQRIQKVQRQILNSPEALPTNCQGSNEATSKAPIAKKAVQTLVEVETRIEKWAAGGHRENSPKRNHTKTYRICMTDEKRGYATKPLDVTPQL